MARVKKPCVSNLDRMTRVFLGAMTMVFAFALPLTAKWFAGLTLASTYPLFTGIMAWDPFYALINVVRERFSDYHIFH
ncbi:MAG: DUF2892 domain-containing protein [Gammaproteobacteria bacterium]|nr:DUF2892 domain-containing protein [Gammaproteobacteria bacterium]